MWEEDVAANSGEGSAVSSPVDLVETSGLQVGSAPAEKQAPVIQTAEIDTVVNLIDEVDPGTEPSNREPAPLGVFEGQLLTTEGHALRGATLSWSPYGKDLIVQSSELDLGPWILDQGRFESITRWTETDDQGRFAFMDSPDFKDGDASVIWATHPDAVALPILLPADAEAWPSGEAYTLQPALRATVRVLDGTGLHVAGATVADLALVQPLHSVQTPLEIEETVRVFLRRSYVTGQDGLANLVGMGGRRQLQASSGARLSAPWRGPAGEDVVLPLESSFGARGTVALVGTGTPYTGELFVVIEGWRGRSRGFQSRVPVNEETLQWGPIQIPIGAEDHFTFSLDALTMTPCTRSIPTPDPEALVTIDLETADGEEVWFGLMNEKDEFLKEGTIEIDWESRDGQRGTFVRKLRADGYVRLLACPPGRVTQIRGHSPGYAGGAMAGPEVPEAEPSAWIMTLQQAGSLRGTCTQNGQPVEDFEVVLWQPGNTRNPLRASFTGSTDGTFSIDEAPLGEVQVLATAIGFGPSVPLLVRVESEKVAEVKLELNSDRVVRGRVLDEFGDSLRSVATVQAYIQAEQRMMTKSGDPVVANSTGAFALRGFAPGLMGIVVSAPGYAPYERWTRGGKHTDQQLGDIRLQSLRDLQMNFHFAAETDATLHEVWLGRSGSERTGLQRLNAEGATVFHGVGPEVRSAWLQFPDGTNEFLKIPRPTAGPWIAEYQMAGTGSLGVDIGPKSSLADLTSATRVTLYSYIRGTGSSGRAKLLKGAPNLEFPGLLPGDYLVEIVDAGDLVRASTLAKVSPGETTYCALELDSGDTVFHVTDRTGAPLSGVAVSAYATHFPLWRHGVTDANGICTIRGTSSMSAFASLQHPTHGSVWDQPVELAGGTEDPIELELDARASIRLRFADGALPIPDVLCRVVSAGNPNIELVTAERSDSDGVVEYEGFSEGSYHVELSGPHIWATELEVPSVRGSDETQVSVRRLGNLRIRAHSLAGHPVPDLAIELIDSSSGTPVADWIQQGRVQASPASARPGADGILDIPAIPHGNYAWRALPSGGGELTGSVEVTPGAWAELVIELAD